MACLVAEFWLDCAEISVFVVTLLSTLVADCVALACVELLLVELVGLLLLVRECRALALGKGEKRASVCEL